MTYVPNYSAAPSKNVFLNNSRHVTNWFIFCFGNGFYSVLKACLSLALIEMLYNRFVLTLSFIPEGSTHHSAAIDKLPVFCCKN